MASFSHDSVPTSTSAWVPSRIFKRSAFFLTIDRQLTTATLSGVSFGPLFFLYWPFFWTFGDDVVAGLPISASGVIGDRGLSDKGLKEFESSKHMVSNSDVEKFGNAHPQQYHDKFLMALL